MTTTATQAHTASLKAHMAVEMGYTYGLTQSELRSATGSKTVTVAYTMHRTPLLCFTRFHRKTWTRRTRVEKKYLDWTFRWRAWCYSMSTNTETSTGCTQLVAEGELEWDSLPAYEWAPQALPCGGVPIEINDPWGGRREEPCRPTVCDPPPPPGRPCCGCEAVP